MSPQVKSLIASLFNSNYRNDKTNNNNNNNVNRKVHSQEPRLPKPPPGIRSASIIEADMSSDDLKRLQDLQQDLEYNQTHCYQDMTIVATTLTTTMIMQQLERMP